MSSLASVSQTLLEKWVYATHLNKDEGEQTSLFPLNTLLTQIMLKQFHASPGCDPTYKLREGYSKDKINEIQKKLGMYGPHFDFTVKAGMITFLLGDFKNHSNNSFLMKSLKTSLCSNENFNSCKELKETFKKWHSDPEYVKKAKKLCRDTAASMLKGWVSILQNRPDRIILQSLKSLKVNEVHKYDSNEVFTIKKL